MLRYLSPKYIPLLLPVKLVVILSKSPSDRFAVPSSQAGLDRHQGKVKYANHHVPALQLPGAWPSFPASVYSLEEQISSHRTQSIAPLL